MWGNTEHLRKAGSPGMAMTWPPSSKILNWRQRECGSGEGAWPCGGREGSQPCGGRDPAPWGEGGQPRGGQHPVSVVSGHQDIFTGIETSPSEPRGPEVPGDLGRVLPLGIPWEVCSSPYFKSQNK